MEAIANDDFDHGIRRLGVVEQGALIRVGEDSGGWHEEREGVGGGVGRQLGLRREGML